MREREGEKERESQRERERENERERESGRQVLSLSTELDAVRSGLFREPPAPAPSAPAGAVGPANGGPTGGSAPPAATGGGGGSSIAGGTAAYPFGTRMVLGAAPRPA